jgi:hypothetical protein
MSSSEDSDGEPLVRFEEILSWKGKELRAYLEKHQLKVSGLKEVLAKRVYRHMTAEDSSSEADTDCEPEEVAIPSAHNLAQWQIVETTNIPPIQEKDVQNFYAFFKHVLSGATLNFSNHMRKARRMCNENYLKDIAYHPIADAAEFCYFKAICRASMRDAQYNVTVCLASPTGMVLRGYCTCKAGQSSVCCHVGALLFRLVKMKEACTNLLCPWLEPRNPSTKLTPQRFRDIKLVNTTNSTNPPSVKPYPGVYRASACNDPDQFLKDLLEGLGDVNPTCVLYQVMCSTVDDIEPFFVYTGQPTCLPQMQTLKMPQTSR